MRALDDRANSGQRRAHSHGLPFDQFVKQSTVVNHALPEVFGGGLSLRMPNRDFGVNHVLNVLLEMINEHVALADFACHIVTRRYPLDADAVFPRWSNLCMK
jgi:hypothetical protein